MTYLRREERVAPSHWFSAQMPAVAWARLGARNSVGTQLLAPSLPPVRVRSSRKLELGATPGSNPHILIWELGVLSGVLIAKPNSHPAQELFEVSLCIKFPLRKKETEATVMKVRKQVTEKIRESV